MSCKDHKWSTPLIGNIVYLVQNQINYYVMQLWKVIGQFHVQCQKHKLPLITAFDRTNKRKCGRKKVCCCSYCECDACAWKTCFETYGFETVGYVSASDGSADTNHVNHDDDSQENLNENG